MGYSGATAPVPMVACLPDDWWDPAWQAMRSPGATGLEPAICEPGETLAPAAAATGPETRPAAPPPSWGQVLATTFRLWATRRLPWLRVHSRRSSRWPLAASALAAGLVAVVVGTTGLAVAVLSPASAAQLPARPVPIPVPSGRTVLPASLGTAQPGTAQPGTAQPAARPVWVSVPAIGVRTSLIDLGLAKNGTLQVPASTAVAGWYTGGPRPGAVGAAVIAGHVDSRTGPGIFFWLRALRPGDRVYVGRADGTMAVFTVTIVRIYAKDQFPTAAVYGAVPDAELRLITCGGVFDRSLGSYLSNVVVFARLSG
ncbi:MAG: class F sortase [Streptosporangiaceae bacterium]